MLSISNETLFTTVVERAKLKAGGEDRWCSAIDRAASEITADATFFHWTGTHMLIQSPTSSEVYEADGHSCGCEAFTFRKPCKHRAAYRLWKLYLEALASSSRVNTETTTEAAVLVASRPKRVERVRGFQI